MDIAKMDPATMDYAARLMDSARMFHAKIDLAEGTIDERQWT